MRTLLHKKLLFVLFLGIGAMYIFTAFTYPAHAAALTDGLWKGTSCAPGGGVGTGPTSSCSFCDGIIVTQNIIGILFEIAFPIAVGMIVYGAIRLMLAGGSESNVSSGKEIITNAIIGLVIALCAWVIVNEVLHLLTGDINLPWSTITCV